MKTLRCDELQDARPDEGDERPGTPSVPKLEPDPGLDPFGDHQIPPDSETGLLLQIVLSALPGDSTAWQQRLVEVTRILSEHARDVLLPPTASSHGAAEADVGLLFVLAQTAFPSLRFAAAELHAALALWLLVQSEIARRDGRKVDALRMRKACLWCMPNLFVSSAEAKGRRHRSRTARIGTDARHEFNRQRKERLLSDFRAGTWLSKNRAAAVLAERHALSVTTVRKLLQGK